MGRKCLTVEQIWKKVDIKTENECWNWLAGLHRDGYGKLKWKGITKPAHRHIYEMLYGEIPSTKIMVRHKCDNKKCCNPNHLELGTAADNVNDMMIRGRHKFISNPPKGVKHPKAKLTDELVLYIRKVCPNGNCNKNELARKIGVDASLIGRVARRKSWGHVND